MKNNSFIMTIAMFIIATNSMTQKAGTFTDSRDGKTYKTVKIGDQIWMAENLAYKAKTDCWAYENKESNVTTFGYLYDFEAAMKACPAGWHLPGDLEWTILTNYLGGEDAAGGKLKSTTDWTSPNAGATNLSGFSALPGGEFSYDNNTFSNLGNFGYWWTVTTFDNSNVWSRYMVCSYSNVDRIYRGFKNGFSVRCVKD